MGKRNKRRVPQNKGGTRSRSLRYNEPRGPQRVNGWAENGAPGSRIKGRLRALYDNGGAENGEPNSRTKRGISSLEERKNLKTWECVYQ